MNAKVIPITVVAACGAQIRCAKASLRRCESPVVEGEEPWGVPADSRVRLPHIGRTKRHAAKARNNAAPQ